jgi:hypothetical protein
MAELISLRKDKESMGSRATVAYLRLNLLLRESIEAEQATITVQGHIQL